MYGGSPNPPQDWNINFSDIIQQNLAKFDIIRQNLTLFDIIPLLTTKFDIHVAQCERQMLSHYVADAEKCISPL